MSFEIEVKYRVKNKVDFEDYQKKLSNYPKETFNETNYIYDFFGILRKKSLLIRLRFDGKKYLFTYKGKKLPGKYKTRREVEFKIPKLIFKIVELFPKSVTYYKTRTEYTYKHAKVCFDYVTDLGYFIEIEGKNDNVIDKVKKELQFKELPEKKSYPSLMRQFLTRDRK